MKDFKEDIWERLAGWWQRPGEERWTREEKEMLREQFEARRALRGMERREWDVERAWRRVRPRGGRRRWLAAGRWAAAVAVGVVAAYALWQDEKGAGVAVSPVAEMARETREPELQLASGERVSLKLFEGRLERDSARVEIVNDTASGRLAYRAESREEGVATAWNTLVVPRGRVYSLRLADGTMAWVNAGSVLRFPERFGRGEREVMVEGEVYLEVARDEERPFRVRTTGGEVVVLGTKFNVRAYADEGEEAVTLAEGKVEVRATGGRERVTLAPGEQARLAAAGDRLTKQRVDPRLYCSWHEGKWLFKNQKLADIMRLVERRYDVEVRWVDNEPRERTFSGEIRHFERVEEVLKILELADNIAFQVKGKTVEVRNP